MKNILNQVDNVILIVNDSGIIQFANQPALNFFDITASQAEGLPVNQLLNLNITQLASALNNDITLNTELCLKNSKKLKFHLDITEQLWDDTHCYMIVIRSRKKEIPAHLLQQLLDELPFSVWVKNEQGQLVYVNSANIKRHQTLFPEFSQSDEKDFAEQLMKQTYNSEHLQEIWDDQHHNELLECIEKAKKYNQIVMNKHTLDFNGDIKTIENYFIPLYNTFENTTYVGCVSRDITFNTKLHEVGIQHIDELTHLKKLLYPSHHTSDYSYLYHKLKSSLSAEFNADHLGLWVYEHDRHCIKFIYDSDSLHKDLELPSFCPITADDIAALSSIPYLNRIAPLEERLDFKQYPHLEEQNIGFVGTYEIRSELDNSFLGFLNVVYYKDNPPSPHQEYIIQSTCKQLGLLLQNSLLLEHIQEEFNKREIIERELEVFLSTAVDLIAIIDTNTGRFIRVNEKWQELLGWTSEELLQKMCLENLEHPLYHHFSLENLNALTEEESLHNCRAQYRTKCGNYKLFECNYKRIAGENMAIFTAKDITEREKLRSQKEQLEDTVRLESLRTEFFANISHELRTPLNIIISTIQLLDIPNYIENISSNARSRYIKSMRQNAYRLLKLINNIIDITRIDAGYYNINLGNYNIVSLVEDICDSTLGYMQSKNIEFIFDTEVEEEYIACDPDLIERIILNLLSNSIKYSRPDVPNQISIMITLEKDFVVINVIDKGIGIPADKLKVIFERFIQVDNLLTRKREGSGIGLSLVKSLVEMHDGQILVQSQPEQGSKFTVKLPRKTILEESLACRLHSNKEISTEKYIVEFSDIHD